MPWTIHAVPAAVGWPPKVQLFTVAELLAGKKVEMPPIRQVGVTFKKAPKAIEKQGEQQELQV